MRTKVQYLSYDEVLHSLRGQGFDVAELPAVAGAPAGLIQVKKNGIGAILGRNPQAKSASKGVPQHSMVWIHHPGLLVGGEIGVLLDRGYQKFWKTPRVEVPAVADTLKAEHRFAEELRETIGEPSLYNESLGTTSDVYWYDRVRGRDLPPAERPKPAWESAPQTGPKQS
jgi:hypothetical protein